MMFARLGILFFILLLSLSASAQSSQVYEITQHTIDISLDEMGNAQVAERFFLSFPREFYLNLFKQASEENGISLSSWKSFDTRIHTYIGDESDLLNAQVSFVEDTSQYLELTYTLKTPIMHVTSDTSRRTDYKLKENAFREFLVGTLWIVPDNTTIAITIPPQAELQGAVKPEASIVEKTIIFQGYKSSNVLEIRYRIWKQIASFNFQEIASNFVNSELTVFLGIIVFVVLIMGYVKRKKIVGGIEEYIVDHTELAPSEDQQE